MLDIKLFRSDVEKLKEQLAKKNVDESEIDKVIALDLKRRNLTFQVEQLKNKQNQTSKLIPTLKKEGGDVTEILAEMKTLSDSIKEFDKELIEIDDELFRLMLSIPNIPHEHAPIGETDEDNVEIRKWGEPRKFDFEIKAHWDLGVNLDIIDFERASKIAGSRFAVLKGAGAKLERALISFFLDTHEKNGYSEVFPPYMVSRESMIGTGQLPKFEEDAFLVQNNGYFLIPTAEVPVTNLYRDEILPVETLPIMHAAYSACFRAEAGSAGRDTRGLIRQHQFNKVELIKFVVPESSYDELDSLTRDAELLLKLLKLPYRVVEICTGDLGFTAAKKYDIEVYLPSYGRYVEISSCSNFLDYQARRMNIKFKRSATDKSEFIHTINGSGLAVGRCFSAVIENYQNGDGSITIPDVLVPYMGGKTSIQKQ